MDIPGWHRNVLAAALLTASAGSLWADPILTLTPSPDQAGTPGSTVGWGFIIANDTSDYLIVSSSQFCLNPVLLTPAFACTSPLTGVYSDIIAATGPTVGPHSSLSENFDPIGLTSGVGYFEIDPNAASSSSDAGQIVLTYDGFDGDPNSDSTNQVLFSVPLAADASVTVVTPEPATWALLATALAILAIMGLPVRRRQTA